MEQQGAKEVIALMVIKHNLRNHLKKYDFKNTVIKWLYKTCFLIYA